MKLKVINDVTSLFSNKDYTYYDVPNGKIRVIEDVIQIITKPETDSFGQKVSSTSMVKKHDYDVEYDNNKENLTEEFMKNLYNKCSVIEIIKDMINGERYEEYNNTGMELRKNNPFHVAIIIGEEDKHKVIYFRKGYLENDDGSTLRVI